MTPAQPTAAFAAGTTYYVAKTGSDTTGNGSSSSPWATIQKAANTIASGDTVRVASGTYNERVTVPATKSGVAGTTTKFIADGAVVVAQGVVVQSSYTDLTGFEVTPGSAAQGGVNKGQVEVAGSYNKLDGFNIHNLVNGTALMFSDSTSASYNTVSNLKVDGAPFYGVGFGRNTRYNTLSKSTIKNFGGNAGIEVMSYAGEYAMGSVIEDVVVAGPSGWNASGPYDGDGIRVNGPKTTIRRSVIRDIFQERNPSGPGSPHTDCIQFWTQADGLLIEDSIIGTLKPGSWDGTKGASDAIMAEVKPGETINWTMRNNLVLSTMAAGPGGTFNSAVGTGATLKATMINNTFWGPRPSLSAGSVFKNNLFKDFGYGSLSLPITSDYNMFVTGSTLNQNEGTHSSIIADPKFTNADFSAATNYGVSANFKPAIGSPLIGRADSVSAPTADIQGTARTLPTEIGAYAKVGTTAPPADTTAPTVSITSPGTGSTVSGTVAIAANSADAGSGVARVEFRADGVLLGTDTTAPYASTWNATAAAVGPHVLEAKAYDVAGNSAVSNVTVNVPAPADIAAPTTSASIDRATGSTGWYQSVPLVSLLPNEAAVTEYQWDGLAGIWNGYTGAVSAPQGTHTLYFRSTDTAGNVESAKSITLKVDSAAPSAPSVTSATHPDPFTPDNSASAGFGFTAADGVSGVAGYSYGFDQSASTTPDTITEGAAASTSIIPGSDGVYYLHVRALDVAGNWGPTAHRQITVDRTGPTAPVIGAVPNGGVIGLAWTPASDSLSTRVLRSTVGHVSNPSDPSATLVYEGTSTTYSDAAVVTGTTYYYTAFSRDLAGNWSTSGTAAASWKTQPQLKLTSSAASVKLNRYVTLRGQYLVDEVTAIAPVPVSVWSNTSGIWTRIGVATYDSVSKSYSFRTRITKTASYQLRCDADATSDATVSNSVTVQLRRL